MARRAGKRPAAPFAKDRRQGRGGRPGRRAGTDYGMHGCRRRPTRVDETHAAPVPPACPDCDGKVEVTRLASQYQEDLPQIEPVVRLRDRGGPLLAVSAAGAGPPPAADLRCVGRGRRNSARTSPRWSRNCTPGWGVPLAKVSEHLKTTFRLQVTPGGLAHLLHRTARRRADLRGAVRAGPPQSGGHTG